MVHLRTQTSISCKIKQDNGDECDCVLCDPWIEFLLEHKLMSLEDFRIKQGFFLHLFIYNKLEGHFILSPIIEVVGYSTLKAN